MWRMWLLPFIVISTLYILTFVFAVFWFFPAQSTYIPQISKYTSLLFLPHGVRILSAWLLGWRSIILIAPSALYTHWLILGWAGFSPLGIMGAMCGVVCAALTFGFLAKVGMDFHLKPDANVHWTDVMLVGVIASIVNNVGLGLAFGHNAATMSGFFIGDITGLFACLLILMLAFRLLRSRNRT
jgi:hypothetical protein